MSEELQNLYQKATQLRQEEKWEEVILVLTEIIRLETNPEDQAVAYNNRGTAYNGKEEYDRAIADYDKAIKLQPDAAETYFNRGAVYGSKEEYDRAIADYDKAIKLQPDAAEAYFNRGNAYDRKEEYDRAIADYDKAIKLQPDAAEAYFNRGNAYDSKEEYDRAIADYDKAIKLQPDAAEAYFNRGAVYSIKKEYDHAIADYDNVIKLQPNDVEAYLNRGTVYGIKEEYDRAIADFDKAIKLQPDAAEVYFNRGAVYGIKEEYDRAIADFGKAIELQPDAAKGYFNRGNAYYVEGEYEHAIADFDKAIALQPNDGLAYHNRGAAYVSKGDHDRAIVDFDKAIKLRPNDASGYYNRGTVYHGKKDKKDYKQAFENFIKAGKDKKLTSIYPLVYIATRLESIFSEDKKRIKLFEHYCGLVDAIDEIREKLLYKPGDGKISHYTSLHALKSFAEGEPFRLYNVAYMNDPEEGKAFFEVMKNKIDVEEIFYKSNMEEGLHPSPAYIGSFVRVLSESERRKDKLSLWHCYGKHDGEEAAGACLIFNTEQFARNISPMLMGNKVQSQSSERENVDTGQKLKPEFYRVIYKGGLKSEDGFLDNLNKLASALKEIEAFCESHAKEKEVLFDWVRKLLDGIRFLFKADGYSEEQEVRVVRVSYYADNEKQSERKIAMEEIPPRFYLEMLGNFRFSEIILGPKADGVFEWKEWLKEKYITNVRKSEIKFRGSR